MNDEDLRKKKRTFDDGEEEEGEEGGETAKKESEEIDEMEDEDDFGMVGDEPGEENWE